MTNRGGGLLNYLFGKRMTSADQRKRSAELRERRLANIPGTSQNMKKQRIRRETMMNQNRASEKTRKSRLSALSGTEENIQRHKMKQRTTRKSGSRSKSGSK